MTSLAEGKNVVCDRYAYSGVAFSSAKERGGGSDGGSGGEDLGIEWCKACDVGLPAPDCVIFLDLSQEESEKRGGYVIVYSLLYSLLFLSHLSLPSSSASYLY